VIGFLCQHGADPNEGNKAMKSTPLHCAAWNGHADCVSELILRGANPHVKNQDGLTPLDAALRDGRADTYAALQKPPTHSAAEALGPMSAKQRADLTKMRMQQFPVAAGVGISSPAAPPNYGKQAFSRFN
jgi:ankyrin repeat protein